MTHPVENSPFALHNRKEIVFVLEDLAKHRVAINLETQEGARLVTVVLGVYLEANQAYVDISQDEQLNDKIIKSKHISFVTQTGVKVRWHTTHLQPIQLQDGPAFAMHLPAVIERVQRREFFRLNTPQGGSALVCRIPSPAGDIEAQIFDISVGGVGIFVRGALPEIFSQGALLEKCSITLPVVGPVPTHLRVRGIWHSTKTLSGDQLYRVGLEFEELSRGASNVIQRYINQLETETLSLG